MPTIRTELLKDGMVLTACIKNADGMLLMPEGCVLTQKHITLLTAWSVADVQVESCDGLEEPSDILERLSPEDRKRITDELKALFWDPIEHNPVQTEVFGLALRRKAKQILSKEDPAACN